MSKSKVIQLFIGYAVLTAVTGSCIAYAEIPDVYTQDSILPNSYGAYTGVDRGVMGVAVMSGTQNSGGSHAAMLPIIEYNWSNGWFAGTRQGIGHSFSQSPDLQYGIYLNADLGRPVSGPSNNIGTVGPKPVLGTFANYSLSREWMLSSTLRYGAGNHGKGAVLDLGANYNVALSPRLDFGAGVGASLANSDYMQSYFGVNAEQSQRSGYAQYSPSAGVKDVRANLTLRFHVNKEIALSAGLTATRFSNAASPIVSPANPVSGLLGATYAF